jgi:hypothetical protein
MKTQRMSIKEFINTDYEKKKYSMAKNTALFGVSLPLCKLPMNTLTASAASSTTYQATPVAAMTSQQIYDKMLVAFEPVTTLIQALAYPLASIIVLVGAILMMCSRKDKGIDMISNAGLGIILVNILPLLLNILVEIMKGIV